MLATGDGVVNLDTTVSSQQLAHQMDGCDPLACVLHSHSPSVQMYFALRSRLESSSAAWLQEFVSLDGLDSLLDSMGHMTGPSYSGFSDAILQIDCLSCIRTVLNSRVGLDALVNSTNGTRKLIKGLDIVNTLPRKQVLEILSAVCVYNKLAYRRVMEALETHKRENHLYHRFSVIVNELKMAETVPHKVSVLTFINCIIASTTDRSHRTRLRNELIGLGLLDVLSFLQREDSDEDLFIQLQVFQEKKHEDESCCDPMANLDLSSPQDLTDAIQAKVFGGPKMVCFVNMLQDLLALETLEKENKDVVWHLLEQQVRHIVHGIQDPDTLSGHTEESMCRVLSSVFTTNGQCADGKKVTHLSEASSLSAARVISCGNSSSSVKRDGVSLKTSADSGYLGFDDKLSPPALTPVETVVPEEVRGEGENVSTQQNPLSHTLTAHQDENADIQDIDMTDVSGSVDAHSGKKRRQVSQYDNMSPVKTPLKAKDLNRGKPKLNDLNSQDLKNATDLLAKTLRELSADNNVKNSEKGQKFDFSVNLNICNSADPRKSESSSSVGSSGGPQRKPFGQHSFISYQKNQLAFPAGPVKNLKWIKLDEAALESFPHCVWSNMDVGRQKVKPDFAQVEEMFREISQKDDSSETPLLSSKTRLNVNLFLNRLEEDPTELVGRLVRVDRPPLALAFMRHLMQVLPQHEEIEQLKQYRGNLLTLGQAEQFVMHLSDLPDYQTLLMGQLRRAELSVTIPQLKSVLASTLEASRIILSHEGLREVLSLILRLGNFLNHGQFNGYASGFKLTTLMRLTDVKGQEAGHNFVHYLTSLVDNTDHRILSFVNEISKLDKAVSCSLSDIKNDFDKINTQINAFVIQLATANSIIRNGFDSFLEDMKHNLRDLQSQISELKHQSQCVAQYFCESESFDLQTCLRTLLQFFKDLRTCRQEVLLMSKQKQEAVKHSNMFSRQIMSKNFALQFGQEAGASSSILEDKLQVIEAILTELHRGNFTPATSLTSVPTHQVFAGSSHPASGQSDGVGKSPKVNPAPHSNTTTPDRELNPMELSRISLMGTPMMNRPCSELIDEELTISTLKLGTRLVTSSVKNIADTASKDKAPVMAIPKPLVRTVAQGTRGHYRSRSDLANSSSVTGKWIRYQDQLKREQLQVKAPLARPESSMTLATLNLEARGHQQGQLYPQPVALMKGPTIALPPEEEIELPADFIRSGRKNERKSALSNFINRISKRVLKPRNPDPNVGRGSSSSEPMHGKQGEGRKSVDGEKVERGALIKGGSLGRASGNGVKSARAKMSSASDEKENVCAASAPLEINPFDRSKKNPIRLSNRFKGKTTK